MPSESIKIENKKLYKNLARIAVPISIQGIVSATLGLVDNLMVGFLGEEELAAVGIATQLFFIHYLIMYGFVSGTATFMTQFYGARDMKNIRRVIGFTVIVAFGVGAVFFSLGMFLPEKFLKIYTSDLMLIEMALPYVKIGAVTVFFMAISIPIEMAFKATQQMKIPLVISTVVFSTNTFLNYVFIFGKFGAPEMGIAGAAMATAFARFLELVISVIFSMRGSNCFRAPFREFFGWDKVLVIRIIKNAWPTTLNEFLWSVGQTMYVAAFSRLGTTAYAAYQAAAAINSIFTFAAFSVGDATLILVGEKLGEGDKDYTYALAKRLLRIGTIIGGIVGLILIALANPLVGLFSLSELGKSYAVKILIVYGLCMSIHLYNGINITGTLRGGGDTRFAMIAECSCVWFVAVPLAFAASLWWNLPIYIAVLVVRMDDAVKFILMTKRFFSKKWMNNVIKGL